MSLLEALLLDPQPLEVWIAKRPDSVYGSGTLNDPWDGSTSARLDKILSQIPSGSPTLVHLGPGEFLTKGYTDEPDSTPGWEIKPGMRLVGAGVGVTTLKLDSNSPGSPAQVFAVGHRLTIGNPATFNLMDFCEVSDLTIHCNAEGQSFNVAPGAIRLMGNHVRVRRVKVVGWGNLSTGNAAYVIQIITAHTDSNIGSIELEDAVIEECVATTPSQLILQVPGTTTTLFHVGAKEDAAIQAEGYGLAPVIRDCFVDGTVNEETDPLAADIRALSMGSCRAGIVEGNQVHNVRIGGPYQDKASTRQIVIRGNTYKNVVRGPWWNLGGLGSGISITAFALVGSPPSAVVLASCTDHNLTKGDRIRISGASQAVLNGLFVVSDIPGLNQFQYVMASSLSSVSGTATMQKVYGVSNLLVEQNVIELATTSTVAAIQVGDGAVGAALGAGQGPEYAHTEAILRGNKLRYLNGQMDPSYLGYGIDIAGVKDVIVRDQILELVPANPLTNARCLNATYFCNAANWSVES